MLTKHPLGAQLTAGEESQLPTLSSKFRDSHTWILLEL